MYKSYNCTQNEHGLCEGIIMEKINDSKITKICMCQCHNSMYHIIRNTLAVLNQSNNLYNYNQNDFDKF